MVMRSEQRKSVVDAFATPLVKFIFSLFAIFLIMFAHCIWMCERWSNGKQFRKEYVEGVADGFWWAAVTTGTVGYGDKTPISPCGKLLTLSLMFWSLIMSSFIVAAVTSSLSSTIFFTGVQSVDELMAKRVGIIPGRASGIYARENVAAEFFVFDTLSQANEALVTERIDAILEDVPHLVYHSQFNHDTRVVGSVFFPHRYALAFPVGSPLLPLFNEAIDRLERDGTLHDINALYISRLNVELQREAADNIETGIVSGTFTLALIVVLITLGVCGGSLVKRATYDRHMKPADVKSMITLRGTKTLFLDIINSTLNRPSPTFDGLIHSSSPAMGTSAAAIQPMSAQHGPPSGDIEMQPLPAAGTDASLPSAGVASAVFAAATAGQQTAAHKSASAEQQLPPDASSPAPGQAAPATLVVDPTDELDGSLAPHVPRTFSTNSISGAGQAQQIQELKEMILHLQSHVTTLLELRRMELHLAASAEGAS